MVNPITDKKIKTIGEIAYDLSDDLNLSADDVIDIAVDILYLIVTAVPSDESLKADLHFDGLSDAEIESYFDKDKEYSDAVKKSLAGFIGDEDKTIAFIKLRLKEISAANDNGGADNGS